MDRTAQRAGSLWLVPGLEDPFTLQTHTQSSLSGLKSCADSQELVLRVRLGPPSRRMLLCCTEALSLSGLPRPTAQPQRWCP